MTSIFANRPLRARLDGAPLDPALGRHAVSAFVRQALNAPAMAELVFAEPPADALASLRLGVGLAFSVDGSGDLFEGEITAVEYQQDAAQGRVVRLRALDKLHRARLRQRARTLTDLTVADLAGQLAGDLGLGFQCAEHPPTRALIVQHDQNDFDLVVDLAARRHPLSDRGRRRSAADHPGGAEMTDPAADAARDHRGAGHGRRRFPCGP